MNEEKTYYEDMRKSLSAVALESYKRSMNNQEPDQAMYARIAENASTILLDYLTKEEELNLKKKEIELKNEEIKKTNKIELIKSAGLAAFFGAASLVCSKIERTGRFISPEAGNLIKTGLKLIK